MSFSPKVVKYSLSVIKYYTLPHTHVHTLTQKNMITNFLHSRNIDLSFFVGLHLKSVCNYRLGWWMGCLVVTGWYENHRYKSWGKPNHPEMKRDLKLWRFILGLQWDENKYMWCISVFSMASNMADDPQTTLTHALFVEPAGLLQNMNSKPVILISWRVCLGCCV